MSLTGFLELIGGLAMLAGIKNRYMAIGAGVIIAILMLGAIHAHIIRAYQPVQTIIPALAYLVLAIIIILRNLKGFL